MKNRVELTGTLFIISFLKGGFWEIGLSTLLIKYLWTCYKKHAIEVESTNKKKLNGNVH